MTLSRHARTVSRVLRRTRMVATMGPDRRRLVLEAMVRLAVARLVLIAIPFPRLAATWGVLVPPDDPRVRFELADDDTRRIARRVQWAIGAVAPLMPFRAACVQQAVAARGMLAPRGIASIVHFGIGMGGPNASRNGIGALSAGYGAMLAGSRAGTRNGNIAALAPGHAWVDIGGVKVTGFPLDPALVELGCFVRCP